MISFYDWAQPSGGQAANVSDDPVAQGDPEVQSSICHLAWSGVVGFVMFVWFGLVWFGLVSWIVCSLNTEN